MGENKQTNEKIKQPPNIQQLSNPYFCQTLSQIVDIFILFYLDKYYKNPCFPCEIIKIRAFVGPV